MVCLWFAFFFCGIAGLAYQVTWVRYLHQIYGASTPAVAATIAIFFGGMALGALLGGRLFDRSPRPLRAYALLEALIGLSAATVPFLFASLESLLSSSLPAENVHPALLTLASTLLLIVPASLIGATFPAMAALARHFFNPTTSTALFYGLHTLGAVCGSLCVSFWWLPRLGMAWTTWSMALFNLGLALYVGLLDGFLGRRGLPNPPQGVSNPLTPDSSAVAAESPESTREGVRLPFRWGLGLSFLSGALSIGLEILWSRALTLAKLHLWGVFGLVMVAYLAGVGMGSLWMARQAHQMEKKPSDLAEAYLRLALVSLVPLLVFPQIAPWTDALHQAGWLGTWEATLAFQGFLIVAALFPVTWMMGLAFPLLLGLAMQEDARSRSLGRLYAVNTLGGIGGSFFFPFVLMPWLGLSESLVLITLAYLCLPLALFCRGGQPLSFASLRMRRIAGVLGGVGIARIIGVAGVAGVAFVGLGLLLGSGAVPSVDPERRLPKQAILYASDQPSASVSLLRGSDGHLRLSVNGASSVAHSSPASLRLQRRLVTLPLSLVEQPKRALLIGWSNGLSAAYLSRSSLETLDCIEPLAALPELPAFFADFFPSAPARLAPTIVVDDPHRFLRRALRPYDVVIEDLAHLERSSFSSRFSPAYLQQIKARLQPQGVFVSWLSLSWLGPSEMSALLQRWLAVFPHAEARIGRWSLHDPVLGLVGSNAPLASRLVSAGPLSSKTPQDAFLSPSNLQGFLKAVSPTAPHLDLDIEAARSRFLARQTQESLPSRYLPLFAALRSLQATPWAASNLSSAASPLPRPIAIFATQKQP